MGSPDARTARSVPVAKSATALAALLADLTPVDEAVLHYAIIQGEEMGRPSLLQASVHKRCGIIAETRIGGACVPVLRGTLTLDD